MAAANSITEEELEEAFRDDPEFALGLLHEDYRHQIGRYIKSKLWALPPAVRTEEMKDVYQDTMLHMVSVIRSPDFDGRKPLRIVYDIARKRAIDVLRRRKFRPKQGIDDALQQIAKDLSGTKIGLEWKLLDKVVWAEFRQALIEAMTTVLTPKQLIVARCYVDNYEEFGQREIYAPLARLVGEITGEVENVVTIKKLWQEAKKRLVKEVTRKGFSFLETEE